MGCMFIITRPFKNFQFGFTGTNLAKKFLSNSFSQLILGWLEVLWNFMILFSFWAHFIFHVSLCYRNGSMEAKKGFRFAGAGVTEGCKLWVWVLGTELRSFRKAVSWCFYQWSQPSFQPPMCAILIEFTHLKNFINWLFSVFCDLVMIVSYFTFKVSISLQFDCSIFWGVKDVQH